MPFLKMVSWDVLASTLATGHIAFCAADWQPVSRRIETAASAALRRSMVMVMVDQAPRIERANRVAATGNEHLCAMAGSDINTPFA
jgi:hypothetical protein